MRRKSRAHVHERVNVTTKMNVHETRTRSNDPIILPFVRFDVLEVREKTDDLSQHQKEGVVSPSEAKSRAYERICVNWRDDGDADVMMTVVKIRS